MFNLVITVITVYSIGLDTIQSEIYHQVDRDSIQFEELLQKAVTDLDGAPQYFIQAKRLAKSPSLHLKLDRMKGWYLYDIYKYDSCISFINKIIKNSRGGNFSNNADIAIEIAACHYLLRSAHVAKGNFKSAIEEGKLAISQLENLSKQNTSLYSSALNNHATDYWRMKKYYKAIETLKKVEKILKKYPDEEIFNLLYINFGLLYSNIHNYNLAEKYLKYLFQRVSDDSLKYPRHYIMASNNLGLVYLQRRYYDQALELFNKGLMFLENNQFEHQYSHLVDTYKGILLGNIGSIYKLKGDYHNAVRFFQLGLNERLKRYGPQALTVAYSNLADAYIELLDYESAEAALTKGLENSTKSGTDQPRLLNLMGKLKIELKDYRQAEEYYDSAIKLNNTVELTDRIFYDHPEVIIRSLLGKAILSTKKKSNPELLHSNYLQVRDVIRFLHAETSSLVIFESINSTLSQYYSMFHELYLRTNDTKWADTLWEISELSKSVKLKKNLKRIQTFSNEAPIQIQAKEQELRENIDSELSKITPGKTSQNLFDSYLAYQEFLTDLKTNYPDYYKFKMSFPISPLSEIRQKLTEEEVILNFYEGENTIYIMKIFKSSIIIQDLDKEPLLELILDFNKAVLINDHQELKHLSKSIITSMRLDEDDLENVKKIIIYPDGSAWKLNFTALQLADSRFLGNEFNIIFKYFSYQTDYKSENNNKVLAFSYEDYSTENKSTHEKRGSLIRKIPGTSREIGYVSNIFNGDYYSSHEASETSFKNLAKSYKILHLAIHGVLDEVYPENSFLKFAESDSINDGNLYLYEILNMNFNSELAVLSACQSGNGDVIEGEGMKSISYGFSLAGAQSVLASRWDVPDISAPALMKYFYSGLSKGMMKSEALKYAQTEFLSNDADNITSAPIYWAGFYIIGNDNPLISAPKWTFYYWLLLIICIAFLIYIARKRIIHHLIKSINS